MEAEYMALTEATKELKWIRTFLTELGCNNSKLDAPTDLYSDNQSRADIWSVRTGSDPWTHSEPEVIRSFKAVRTDRC